MLRIVPLIVSLISVFSSGAMPLDDVGKEVIGQDRREIVMLAEKPDGDTVNRPFVKEPRREAATADIKKADETDKNYAEVEILPDGSEKTDKKNQTENKIPEKKTAPVKNSSGKASVVKNGKTDLGNGANVYDGSAFDADAIFEYRKAELDKQFEKMFRLKERLDEINKESEELWREYYAMRESYDKRFKRLIAEWASDSLEAR